MTTDELIERLAGALKPVAALAAKYDDDPKLCVVKIADYGEPILNLTGEDLHRAEEVLALARQHKGGWRHLDWDAEKPEDQEWYLISDGESILRGHYSEEFNVFGSGALMVKTYRWWMPLPTPPKD